MRGLIPAAAAAALLVSATPAFAQHSGGEGGSGCGDLFGDLIHIKRASTGQPILQKAWVALKTGTYGWAYCPVAVDAYGKELPFAIVYAVDENGVLILDGDGNPIRATDDSSGTTRVVESCDVDPAYGANVVAVDYFGRLSGGRTKERNIRMHLDEVISNIKMSQVVGREATGRLILGNDCAVSLATGKPDPATCTWKAVDSPQENIALYQRIIKYGHIQTNPGDTVQEGNATVLRPALDDLDRAKFLPEVQNVLSACTACYVPEDLTKEDFVSAAGTLSAAADKTGSVTVDLVQYMNRIVRVGVDTEFTVASKNLLPALYRPSRDNPDGQDPDLVYEGNADLVAPANERFLNFAPVSYRRDQSFNFTIAIIKPAVWTNYSGAWLYDGKVPLLTYLQFANPSWASTEVTTGITGFVRATNDGLRTTEFFHNYAVPSDLGWDFKYKVK